MQNGWTAVTYGLAERDLLVFAYGLICGSFLTVVGDRVPLGLSLIHPPSHCTACGRQLRAWELIPVFSWLLLGGRCHTCKTHIPARYPLLELATGALWLFTVYQVPTWPARLAWFGFWLVLLAATATDLATMRIPNVLSMPGALMVYGLFVLTQTRTWTSSLWGAGVGFGLLFLIHLLSKGRMGLGDAKLYLSIGAALGPWLSLESFVLASFFGTLIGLPLRWSGRIAAGQAIPFVPFIALGVVTTFLWGHSLWQLYLQWTVYRAV
ncbi:prepilin peptidase [Alicyclobacillaceae bacterium I2511]|nr:prepilin peptidase [Alicyclobacillaceae bacterium I2511]